MEDFGEHYQEQMKEWFKEGQRVAVDTQRVGATYVRPGMYVMYLPIEVTEAHDMAPRIAQVTEVWYKDRTLIVKTTQGIMMFKPTDYVQAVI